MWQDIIFSGGSIIFTVGLIPQLRDCLDGYALNLWTSTVTTVVLALFCVAYASLGLWLSAIPMTASMWAVITLVSYRNRRRAT
jgi:hypothetical protein